VVNVPCSQKVEVIFNSEQNCTALILNESTQSLIIIKLYNNLLITTDEISLFFLLNSNCCFFFVLSNAVLFDVLAGL